MLERVFDLIGVPFVEDCYQDRTLIAKFVLVRFIESQFPGETSVIRDVQISVSVLAQVLAGITYSHNNAGRWAGEDASTIV